MDQVPVEVLPKGGARRCVSTGHLLWRLWAGSLLILATFNAPAQSTYPTRAVRLIVPYSAGGTTDVIARLFMDRVAAELGQPVVVDNRGGAGGTIGMAAVARALPDGYTIGFGNSGPNAIAASFQKDLTYDPIRDFQAVALVAEMPLLLIVNAASPLQSLADFVKSAHGRPEAVSFATTGVGSFSHVTGELFARAAGIKLLHVPYKSGAESMQDLLAGRVDSTFSTYLDAAPHLKAGKVRAIAITSASRLPLLPDVPAVGEKMIPGFEAVGWFGVLAPAGTPRPIIDRLSRDLDEASKNESVRSRLASLGFVPAVSTPEQFAARIKADVAKWASLIKQPGVTLN
jgi:tripartite-type tricarboxylate transporter receptor subunit TctC